MSGTSGIDPEAGEPVDEAATPEVPGSAGTSGSTGAAGSGGTGGGTSGGTPAETPAEREAFRRVPRIEEDPAARQAREVREAEAEQAQERADEALDKARNAVARAEATLHDQIMAPAGGEDIEDEDHLDRRDTRGAWPNWTRKK
jgi:hypothetical protein